MGPPQLPGRSAKALNCTAVLLQGAEAPSCEYLAAALAHNLGHWDVTHLHAGGAGSLGATRARTFLGSHIASGGRGPSTGGEGHR